MEKQEKIVQMFNDIAPTYDLANRVLSMGADVSWRKIACKTVLSNFKDRKSNRRRSLKRHASSRQAKISRV